MWIELNKNTLAAFLNVSSALNDPSTQPFIVYEGPGETWNMKNSGFKVGERVDGSLPGTKPPSSGVVSPLNVRTSLAQQLSFILTVLFEASGGKETTYTKATEAVLEKVLKSTVTQQDIDNLFSLLERTGVLG